jgi:hypothetical protein
MLFHFLLSFIFFLIQSFFLNQNILLHFHYNLANYSMWHLWQSHNILNIDWIVDWLPTFLQFCKITALSTFLIMSKSSNVFFFLGLIFHPKDFFYFFKINVANITEWWKRQLECSSHFTINNMESRNCVGFFLPVV